MKNLAAYVNQCRDKVPFYREKYKHLSRDFCWKELPFLTPEEFSQNTTKLVQPSLDLTNTPSFVGSGTSKQVRRVYLTENDIEKVADNWRDLFYERDLLGPNGSVLFTVPSEEMASAFMCRHVLPRRGFKVKAAKSIDEHVEAALEGVDAILTGVPIIRMMIENAEKRGIPIEELKISKMLIGGEDISEYNYKLMSQIKAPIVLLYGLSEAGAPLATEKVFGEGYELYGDLNYVEIDSNLANQGELIITNLGREGTRLIRYRTGDLVKRLSDGKIKILGRVDKSAVIGHMTFFLTGELENSLLNAGIGDFRMDITHEEGLDALTVYTKNPFSKEDLVDILDRQDPEFGEQHQDRYFTVRTEYDPKLETTIGHKHKRIRDLRKCCD